MKCSCCLVNVAVGGFKTCATCRMDRRIRMNRLIAERRDQNRCISCGKYQMTPQELELGYSRCPACRIRNKKATVLYRKART